MGIAYYLLGITRVLIKMILIRPMNKYPLLFRLLVPLILIKTIPGLFLTNLALLIYTVFMVPGIIYI